MDAPKTTSVLQRKLILKKPVRKVKLVLVEEPKEEMRKMPTELQMAIINRALKTSANIARLYRLYYHYKVEYEGNFIWTKGEDGIMRKVNCENIFKRDFRTCDDEYRNRYFSVLDIKTGEYTDEKNGKTKTTIKGQRKIIDTYYTGVTKKGLRLYMTENGCENSVAMAMSYKDRVKWVMTADYDKEDGEVWKDVLNRHEKKVAIKEKRKNKVELEIAELKKNAELKKAEVKKKAELKKAEVKKKTEVKKAVVVKKRGNKVELEKLYIWRNSANNKLPNGMMTDDPALYQIAHNKAGNKVEFMCELCKTIYGDYDLLEECCAKKKVVVDDESESDDENGIEYDD